jgi:hypothetical protein
MRHQDLYGAKGLELDELTRRVSEVLSREFSLHDSLYYGGGYYRSGIVDDEEILIMSNDVTMEDEGLEYLEPDFSDYPLLLRVDETTRGDEIKRQLEVISSLTFLRRDDIA